MESSFPSRSPRHLTVFSRVVVSKIKRKEVHREVSSPGPRLGQWESRYAIHATTKNWERVLMTYKSNVFDLWSIVRYVEQLETFPKSF